MRASHLSLLLPKSLLNPLTVGLLAMLLVAVNAEAADDSQKQMLKEAKVDRTHAEVIALGRVHGGGVKSSKIERTQGHLVWSFEIMMPGGGGVREVLVDARTGKIVSLAKQTAAQSAKEAKDTHRQRH